MLQSLLRRATIVKQPNDRAPSGFTLLEVLVVVMIIGVLSAIAAPGWVAFTQARQVNAAREQILLALRDAQRQAKLRKVSYAAFFRVQGGIPQVAVYPASVTISTIATDNGWKVLGDNRLKSGQLLLASNLTTGSVNRRSSSSTVVDSTGNTSIVFDYMGVLPEDSDTNLRVTVALARQNGSNTPIGGTRRCVEITSLLGNMLTQQQNNCNSW